MQAGKKMDEAVAFHVLGWKFSDGRWADPEAEAGDGEAGGLPAFSKELRLAWRIVDRICDQGFRLQLEGSRIWQARFYKSAAHTLETRAYAATAGEPAAAICLAALEMHGFSDKK